MRDWRKHLRAVRGQECPAQMLGHGFGQAIFLIKFSQLVPKDGLYHLALGNEKAWLLPVSVRFQLFQLQPNGQRVKAQAIPVECLRAQG